MSKKSSKKPAKKLYMIDLFAGCGGLSLGMEQAGFTPILFSEINKDASDTYRVNRAGEAIAAFSDVYDLTNKQLGMLQEAWAERGIAEIDLVCGGPPCQGYSGIGHRRSYAVEKEEVPSNHLYLEMIRVIKKVRPKIFLFENVRGLMTGRWTASGEKGEIFKQVLASFVALKDYHVDFALVQAKNYGVPQNRPRVLIAGIRKDLAWSPKAAIGDAVERGFLPEGEGGAPDLWDVFSDLIDRRYDSGSTIAGHRTSATTKYPAEPKSDFQREIRSDRLGKISSKGDPLTEQEYSNHSDAIREKFQHMIDSGGEIPAAMQTKKFAQRLLPKKWGPDGPNITATSLPDDFVHFSQPRSVTVREWARLQCFPDWYQFRGPRTTGGARRAGRPDQGVWDREVPKYTQIGNAVPVRLARAVGGHFKQILARGIKKKQKR